MSDFKKCVTSRVALFAIANKTSKESSLKKSEDPCNFNNLFPEEIILRILNETGIYILAAVLTCKKWLRIGLDTIYMCEGTNIVSQETSYPCMDKDFMGNPVTFIPFEYVAKGPKGFLECEADLCLSDRMIVDKAFSLFRYMNPLCSEYKPWWLPYLAYHNCLDMLLYLKKTCMENENNLTFYDILDGHTVRLAFWYAKILGYSDVVEFLASIFHEKFPDIHNKNATLPECVSHELKSFCWATPHYKVRLCCEGHVDILSMLDYDTLAYDLNINLCYNAAISNNRYEILDLLRTKGIVPSISYRISTFCVKNFEMFLYLQKHLSSHFLPDILCRESFTKHAIKEDIEDLLDYLNKEWYLDPKYIDFTIRCGHPRIVMVLLSKNPKCNELVGQEHSVHLYLKQHNGKIPKRLTIPGKDRRKFIPISIRACFK